MKNSNNDIDILEQQMANNEDICCSCGNIQSFPKAFFDNFRVADVGIMCAHRVRLSLVVRTWNMW